MAISWMLWKYQCVSEDVKVLHCISNCKRCCDIYVSIVNKEIVYHNKDAKKHKEKQKQNHKALHETSAKSCYLIFRFMYNLDRSTKHRKFDFAGIWTHDI